MLGQVGPMLSHVGPGWAYVGLGWAHLGPMSGSYFLRFSGGSGISWENLDGIYMYLLYDFVKFPRGGNDWGFPRRAWENLGGLR